ncbi:MAG: STAS/SEC14 domain-containing protein [Myxococcales bacterium]|nr:STAS/SEC14 domain-containing protein [Myxococcales bacterium]
MGDAKLLLDHAVALVHERSYGARRVLWLVYRAYPDGDQLGEFARLYAEILRRHAPARTVSDVRGFADAPLGARWEYANAIRGFRRHVRRAAVFGMQPRAEAIIRVIIRVSRRTDLRIVATADEALDWVLQD